MPRRAINGRDHAIGNAIRLYRWHRGLTMKQVGQRVGVTSQQMAKIECGHNRVSAAMLMDIADVLEVSIEQFFLEQVDSAPIATGSLEIGKLYDKLPPTQRRQLLGIARSLAGSKEE